MAKLIKEKGIIVSLELIPAKGSTDFNGKHYDARPERYQVITLSGGDYDDLKGYSCPTMSTHQIADKELFDKLKYGDKVKVGYMYYGDKEQPKAESLEFLKN